MADGPPFPQHGFGREASDIAVEEIAAYPGIKNLQALLEAMASGGSGGGGILPFDNAVFVLPGHPSAVDDTDPATPFVTLQGAIDYFGPPTDAAEYSTSCIIYAASGTYTEDLDVPHRALTIVGFGITIDGSITRYISEEEEFGVSSSTWRGCLSLIGAVDARDNHNVSRIGIRVNGDYECQITPGGTGNTTHDTCFIGTHFEADVKSWDGVLGSNTGTDVLYLTDCRVDGNIEGRNFYCQRWKDCQLRGNIIIGTVVNFRTLEIRSALIEIHSSLTLSGYMGIRDTLFRSAFNMDVKSAGQTMRLDAYSNYWLKANVTQIGNVPAKLIQGDLTP